MAQPAVQIGGGGSLLDGSLAAALVHGSRERLLAGAGIEYLTPHPQSYNRVLAMVLCLQV